MNLDYIAMSGSYMARKNNSCFLVIDLSLVQSDDPCKLRYCIKPYCSLLS